jgi:hypothetical protein
MIIKRMLPYAICLAIAAFANAASAQTWNAEQQELWKLEAQQWQMSRDKDLSWIDKMVHPNLRYWDVGERMPQDKASLARWSRYGVSTSTVLEQEIFPISATVTGNVAVMQYRYRIASENYKKEREIVTGWYTDVLVREGGRWLFIAWAGGDDPKK